MEVTAAAVGEEKAVCAVAEGDHWRLSQIIGDPFSPDQVLEGDIITAVEFDDEGDLLAVGDKAGRISIYRNQQVAAAALTVTGEDEEDKDQDSFEAPARPPPQQRLRQSKQKIYQFYCHFQSHELKFDKLKSMEIEEKINMMKFCKKRSSSSLLLSTNDKVVKLWKVSDRNVASISGMNIDKGSPESVKISRLSIPSITSVQKVPVATCKQVYGDAHVYNINSISPNSDCETFISTDDLRINLWNLDRSDQSFNIVDIKPDNLEDLTEVITCSSFHPTSCNILAYSSSRGRIRLNDLREHATADEPSRFFETPEDMKDSEFAGVVASISHMQFDPTGNHILCRDYMTLKLWDIRNEAQPIQIIPVHQYLDNKLGELYQNECIFDKFECAISRGGYG
eukprot:TRINITY_DN1912_c0_g1_i1.p1 TRINITY_DN1912_c0_g1~~TRINITY_DN1912_c0_g1_i1.p1  ORF type:complete len:396 (-),score=111.20 TRINITY_DN1912_c0_g1_i1:344-1531(-)